MADIAVLHWPPVRRVYAVVIEEAAEDECVLLITITKAHPYYSPPNEI